MKKDQEQERKTRRDLFQIDTKSARFTDTVACSVKKSEGGPVRARRDLFRRGRLLVWNFSRQTRRPASWRRRRLRHTHVPTPTVQTRENREVVLVSERAPGSFFLRFAWCSANKGSNSADFRPCPRPRLRRNRQQEKGMMKKEKDGYQVF